jgi:hypothetical protein
MIFALKLHFLIKFMLFIGDLEKVRGFMPREGLGPGLGYYLLNFSGACKYQA